MVFFKDYAHEIERYCEANGLSFDKARSMCKSSGKTDLWLSYHDPRKGQEGLRNETPMPIVLIMEVNGGAPVFRQTEHTKKYLTN